MSIGLVAIASTVERHVKQQFTTFTDPFIMEGLKSLNIPPGFLSELEGYSRSYYSLEGHMESIHKYAKINQRAPDDDDWHQIVGEISSEFSSFPKVRSLSAKSDSRDFKRVKYHQGTSAGFGYLNPKSENPSHKGPPGQPNHKRAVRIASKIVHTCESKYREGNWDTYLASLPGDSTPDVAFTRTQLTELPKTKVRNVFGEAFHYVLLEGLFAQPLIELFMNMDSFYYIGKDPLTGVTELIDGIPPDREQYVVFDWSGFDSSVHVYEIELAFQLLRSMLIFPDQPTELIFDYVKTLFISRKIAAPNGTIYLRTGGIPSGSFFTHIVGSIINYVRIKYLLKRLNIKHDLIKTHGDDSLVTLASYVDDLTGIVPEAARLGWFINIEKSQLLENKHEIEFLGRSSKFGTNYRNEARSFRLLAYPEYPVDDPQISIARLKGIDMDSGYRMPYLPEVYHYLKSRFGDEEKPLPRKFQRFQQESYVNDNLNVSI